MNLKLTLKAWPVIALATIGLAFATQVVAGWFGIRLPDQASLAFVRAARGMVLVKVVAYILVLAPVVEELVFRWTLFGLPRHFVRRLGFWGPAAVSSLAFVTAHYVGRTPDGGFCWNPLDNSLFALFFFGVAQCWLYRRTGCIVWPMLNHTLFNAVNLALLFVLPA